MNQTCGDRMYINSEIMCRVWDNVQHPIGATQIIINSYDNWSKYLYLIHALNKYGYIVYGTIHTNNHCEENIAIYIKEKYRLPLFLIANEQESDQIQDMVINTDIFVICFSKIFHNNIFILQLKIRKKKWRNKMLKKFISGRTLNINEHVPVLVINSTNNFRSTNGHFVKNLYSAYINYNPEKLTVILYPNIYYQSLISTETKDIKNEVLNFLGTIQNKK